MIVMFPKEERSASDVLKLAERLAALLPQRALDPAMRVVASGSRWRVGSPGLWLFCLGLSLVLFAMVAHALLTGQ